jgi:glycosyltransferase involved in cell wall biosynthesis
MKPGNPLVSIVVPVHNGEAFIDDALRSVLGQTYPYLDIIVVDDGSMDRTYDRVAAYAPRVKCLRHASRSGSASAPRNTGLRHAVGECIAFLDADDILLPDRIGNQVEFLSSHPEVGLVFSDYRNFTASGPADRTHFQTCSRLQRMLSGKSSLVLSSNEARALLAQENFGSACTFMLRRELLKIETGFEPTLRSSEDFHFYYRLSRHTQVGVVNEVAMMRRLHDSNMSAALMQMLSEGIRSRDMLRESETEPAMRGYLGRYIAECHASRARRYADGGEYLQALREDARALFWNFSGYRLGGFCWGIARTFAIATGVHRSRAEQRRADRQFGSS